MFGKRLGFHKSCYKCFLFSDHFVLDISHFQFYLLNSFQFCTFSVHTIQRILMYQNFIQISNNKIKYIIVTDDITAKKNVLFSSSSLLWFQKWWIKYIKSSKLSFQDKLNIHQNVKKTKISIYTSNCVIFGKESLL